MVVWVRLRNIEGVEWDVRLEGVLDDGMRRRQGGSRVS